MDDPTQRTSEWISQSKTVRQLLKAVQAFDETRAEPAPAERPAEEPPAAREAEPALIISPLD